MARMWWRFTRRRFFRVLYYSELLFLLLLLFVSCTSRNRAPTGNLVYKGPIEIGIEPGKNLSGTDIQYVGLSDGSAEFRINEQRAMKKVGDSLDWEGNPANGVQLDLNLRLLFMTEQSVRTGGTVNIEIQDPAPRAETVNSTSPLKFTMPVTYGVDKDELIPGTLIEYQGRDEERGARLGGATEYPYRKTGDSIVWEGKLRDNVWLKLDLRVLFFNESTLRMGGVATLWMEP